MLPFAQDSCADVHQSGRGCTQEMGQPSAVWIEQWTGGILRDSMLWMVEASTQAMELGLPSLDRELLAVTGEAAANAASDQLLPWVRGARGARGARAEGPDLLG